MSDAYQLRLLGAAGLWGPADSAAPLPLPLLGPGKALALVTYLALSPRRTASREHLVDLLYADAEPDGGRRNLRQAVYQLRRMLGEDFLGGDGQTLTLAAAVRIDRDDFLAAVERGDLRLAAELYGGPFFPAFAAPGGAEFEHWADIERQHLQNAFLRVLEALVREAIGQRRFRDAIALARRLRDTAPQREGTWRTLLESLIAAGDWLHAGTEADACEALLHQWGRTGEPATIAAIRIARNAPPESAAVARLAAELVGREGEFEALLTAWGEVVRGHMRHTHLAGIAGIGKSRLLRDIAARIGAAGGRVVTLRANQAERDLPYALAGDIVRALAALPGAAGVAPATAGILLDLDPALANRFPGARSTGRSSDDARRLRTLAIAELVESVTVDHPVALLLDDIHWADPSSLHLIGGLASRTTVSRLLLVTAARPGGEAALAAHPVETLTLRPLDEHQAGDFVASIASIPDELAALGLAARLRECTGGVPLAILETLQLAMDRGALDRDDTNWVVRDAMALTRLLDAGSALERRIEALSGGERRLLLTLSVAGRPVREPVLEHLLRESGDSAVNLVELEARGWTTRHPGGAWSLAHDLIAERALLSAAAVEQASAEAALGIALLEQRSGTEEARLAARHLARASDTGRAGEAFRHYVRGRRAGGDARQAAELACDVVGTAAKDAARGLVRRLPVRLRFSQSTRVAVFTAAALVAVVTGILWVRQPVSLAIAQQPAFATEVGAKPFIVETRDRRGRVTSAGRDSVTATAVGDEYSLTGTTRVRALHGRATFSQIALVLTADDATATGFATIRFTLPDGRHVESQPVVAGGQASRVRLDSALLNGQALQPDRRAVRLRAGERLRGSVSLRMTTNAGNSALMLVAVPAWGDRTTAFHSRALPLNEVTHREVLQLDLEGPAAPGRYRLVFAYAMETEGRFVASGTNWALGTPAWNDGNDLADITSAQAAILDSAGAIQWPWVMPMAGDPASDSIAHGLRITDRRGPPQRHGQLRWLAGTTIEVVVEP